MSASIHAATQPLYIGTNETELGIFASTLDLSTGEFSPARAMGDAPRPGFLALHPKLPLLYSIAREQKSPTGGVRGFRINPQTQALTLFCQQPTGDDGATHLALDPAGQSLVVVHYSGGSTSLLPLDEQGAIQPVSTFIKHTGDSVHPNRQQQPHAHGIAIDQSGQFACVADLGTDEVIVYRLSDGNKLERHSAWKAAPGAGPRHLDFHTNGRWLYCINELNSTMTALEFNADKGKLTEIQTVPTLPADYTSSNSTAEVVVHPSGKFVYGSNRGQDTTVVYSIHPETGQLNPVEFEPTLGGHPRFIGIDPSGKYLVAANRDANNLVSFHIDHTTGKLKPTGNQVEVPQPVCVVFPRNEQRD